MCKKQFFVAYKKDIERIKNMCKELKKLIEFATEEGRKEGWKEGWIEGWKEGLKILIIRLIKTKNTCE